MSEQITPHQLGDHVGREVEMTMRGRIVDAASPCIVNAAAGGNWYPSTLRAMDTTITLLPPPVPDEPTGLGAVVRVDESSGESSIITRTNNAAGYPWYSDEHGWKDWEMFTASYAVLTVIHPGVEVTRG